MDLALSKVYETYAKRLQLSVADKLRTKAKISLATTTTNSSKCIVPEMEEWKESRKKGVRAFCSEPSNKRFYLEEPSSIRVNITLCSLGRGRGRWRLMNINTNCRSSQLFHLRGYTWGSICDYYRGRHYTRNMDCLIKSRNINKSHWHLERQVGRKTLILGKRMSLL